jgi:glycine betaine catabolism B
MPKTTSTQRSESRRRQRSTTRSRSRTRSSSRPKAKKPEFTGEVTTVVESDTIANDTDWIRLERPPGFDWKAGQFTILELDFGNGKVEDHMFSIAASPMSKGLEIATRRRRSAFKTRFHKLRPGDQVAVQPADGSFVLDGRHPAVFITGGIGITPCKSMLEYAADKGLKQSLVLLYSNPTEDDIAFRRELDELAQVNPHIEIHYTLTKDAPDGWTGRRGRIDADMVRDVVPDLDRSIFYVCGPPGMVRDLRALLKNEVGIENKRIKIENFTGY